MKGKTLREKIKKNIKLLLLKSLGYISSQNVSLSELKLNTWNLLEFFVEFIQFLNGAT